MHLFANPRRWRAAIAASLMALIVACGGGGGSSSGGTANNAYGITATGPGVLSVSPLDTATLVYATPLGKLAPPAHVLPTDHVYLYFVDPWSSQQQAADCSARPVYAAGSGVVSFSVVTEAQGDTKVMVQMTQTFMYYYDHVLLLPNVKVGTRVAAGEQIATTTGRCPSMDLGVIDLEVSPPGYLNPVRYGDYGAHVASPYKYFSESLRTLYRSRVRLFEGVPADRDGRVDWGVRGRLVGDWFHASLGTQASASGPDAWVKSVAFAYDWFDGAPRISIGGTIATAGVLAIAAGDPDPAAVSVGSGLVAYQGTPKLGGISTGWLLAQMLADDRIKLEYFAGATSRPTAFTTAAQEYLR